MRRSSAPSVKNKSLNSSVQRPATYSRLDKISNITPTVSAGPSRESALKDESMIGRVCFSVVWNKKTTKKHKTWEGDGTLEGYGGRYVLKDVTGSFLGSANAINVNDLYEGNRLVIGSKEIEIQQRLTGAPKATPSSCTSTEAATAERAKKRKSSNVFKPSLHISKMRPPSNNSIPGAGKEVELIFPTPSYSHQWKYNEAKLTINKVSVTRTLLKSLRPHQREGVIFLYECIQDFHNLNTFGAILADEMGLGKTVQCLAVCHTLLKSGPYGCGPVLKRILLVAPSSLTHHWSEEITKWLSCERLFSYVVDSKHKFKHYPNTNHIPFVITSYEMLLKNSDDFQKVKFDLVVCDEGHRLKNDEVKVAVCLRELSIQRRIILTGTPIQNDLREFFALVDFVNPGLLGQYAEYKKKYEIPIVRSHAPDATEEAQAVGEERAEELNRITNPFILRRTQALNKVYLPKKTEYIVFVRPTELQRLIIEKTLEWYNSRHLSLGSDCTALQMITVLKKVCNHPSLIRTTSQQHSPLVQHLLHFLPQWTDIGPFDSAKLELVQNFLRETVVNCKERVVLVSNHTKTLDMLADLCAHSSYSFVRLDGSTTISERSSIVDKFNDPTSEVTVFLLSAKAGGVGLNLSGASRLMLFDSDWNPATDLQAMSRIWRDGQKRNVKIYRLVTAGTIEEKIFQRQIVKTSLSGYVMDKQPTASKAVNLSEEELKDLFTIQDDFDTCNTHTCLDCNCDGSGKNISKEGSVEKKNPFDIVFCEKKDENNSLGVNELMDWMHFMQPFSDDLLKDACLLDSRDNIIFVFSNTTEISTKAIVNI